MDCICKENSELHELVECIASALDARDPYTSSHSKRVSDMASYMCGCLGLDSAETMEIHIAAHLHDIGKIGIPDHILLKASKLSDTEWEIMKSHPQIGSDILAKSPRLTRIAAIILHHHERWDGKGYPFGASGGEIPLGSRIIAVCDSIDAMASSRAYRAALPLSYIKEEIGRNSGIMYDPVIAGQACAHWDELTAIYSEEQRK